jgi:hypothetical protein
MSNTALIASEKLTALAGSINEWPAYMVLGEELPWRTRLVVAAAAVHAVEGDSGEAQKRKPNPH